MKLLTFIKRNQIQLDKDVKSLCLDAIEIMKCSKDPRHDYVHVNDIIQSLDTLINHEKHTIDYNVLLPAICWHDTWHALQSPTNNVLTLLYRFFYEGIGSAKLFHKYTNTRSIQYDIRKKILKAITKHVRTGWKILDYIFYTPNNIETKILKDLDELDTWSIKRIQTLKKIFFKNKLQAHNLWIMKWYFTNFMMNNSNNIFYLDYSKHEFELRKKVFIHWIIHTYTLIRNNPTKYLQNSYKGTFFNLDPNLLKKELCRK
jgi:hypothetical protein